MFEIFLTLILLFLFPKKEYRIKTQQYPKSRRFGWRRLPLLTTLWWKLRYYLFGKKTVATFNNPADFTFTTTANFDAGTKSDTATITDDYEGATDAIKLSSPPRKKDANDKGVWLMSEGSGDVVGDSSGNGNHGTRYGATWTPSGKFGNALYFDGINDYVQIPNSSSLDFTDDFSMVYWINLNGGGAPTSSFGSNWKFLNRLSTDGGGCFDILTGGSWKGLTLPAGSHPGIGVWFRFVYSRLGSTGKIYINGIEKASGTQTGSMITGAPIRLMIRCDGTYEQVDGTLDEPRILNRALSPAEVLADYNSGLQYKTSGNWKSATKPIASDEKLKVLTVSHTGLSGTYSMQYKILKASDGSVLWSSLVLTSGTTEHWHESDFGLITDEGIQIQRIFAGDGAGTAVGGRIDGICTGIDNLRCIDVNMKDMYVKV